MAVLACSTAFGNMAMPANFEMNGPWVQIGARVSTTVANQNRMVAGVRHLTNGENINSSGACYTNTMAAGTNYVFAQIGAIFKITH